MAETLALRSMKISVRKTQDQVPKLLLMKAFELKIADRERGDR